jgi:hypothetical protein
MNTPRRGRRPIYPPLPTTPFDDDDIAEADIICHGGTPDMVKARVLAKAERYLRGHEGLYIHSATLRGPVVNNPWSRKRKAAAAELDTPAEVDETVRKGKKVEEETTTTTTTTKISSFYTARKNAPAATAMLKLHKKLPRTRNDDDFTMGDTTHTHHRPRRSHPCPEESESPVGVEVSVRWVPRREAAAAAESPSEGSPSRRGGVFKMKQQQEQEEEEDMLDTITVSQTIPPEEEEILHTITLATPEPPRHTAAEEEILETIVVTPEPPPVAVKKARRVKIDFATISPAVVRPPKKKKRRVREGAEGAVKQPGSKAIDTAAGNIMKETSDSASNVQATGQSRAVGTNEAENLKQVELAPPTKNPEDHQNKVPTENTAAIVRVRHHEEAAIKLSIQNDNDNRVNNPPPHVNATSVVGNNTPDEHDDKPTTDEPTATNMVSLIANQRSEPDNQNYAFSGKPPTNDLPLKVMMQERTPRPITTTAAEPVVPQKAAEPSPPPPPPPSSPPAPEVTPWRGTQAQLAAAQDGFFNAMAESPICFDTLQTPAAAHHHYSTEDESTLRPARTQTQQQQRQSMLFDEWPVPLYSSPVQQQQQQPKASSPPPTKVDYVGSSGPYRGRYGQLTPFSAFYSPSPSPSPSSPSSNNLDEPDTLPDAAQHHSSPATTTTKKLRFSDEDSMEFVGMGQQQVFGDGEDDTPTRLDTPTQPPNPSSKTPSSTTSSKRNSDATIVDDGIQYMLDITQPWEIDEELRKLAGTSTPPVPKKKRRTGGGGGASRGSLQMG